MQKFVKLTSVAAPLLRANIDTDAIIPGAQLLKQAKTGFGEGLFAEWRFNDATSPDRTEKPEFILNQEPYRDAEILLAGVNFAREPAVWALRDFGIRCVIAPSYGAIFFANCFNNGVLPVVLPQAQVEELAAQVESGIGDKNVAVDLESCTVIAPDGQTFPFVIAANYRHALLDGLDAIDATLKFEADINEFDSRDREQRPWIYA